MAHEHVMKQIGIRFEFVHEKDKVIKGKRPWQLTPSQLHLRVSLRKGL
jgi:hypothetical protein